MKKNILLAAFLLPSCRLLRKESLSVKTEHQKEHLTIAEDRYTLNQQSQVMLIDSSHADFKLMLWPKGKFTYSLAKGFDGEAERVIIYVKNTQVKLLETKQQTQQDHTSLKANYTKEKESSRVVQKQKDSLGFNWGGIMFLGIILVLFLAYRKF